VDHFREDHDMPGSLQQLHVVVVRAGQHPVRDAARQAAFEQAPVLVRVGRPVGSCRGAARGGPLLSASVIAGIFADRRIDDQRCRGRLHDFLAVVEPPDRVNRLICRRSRIVRRTAFLALQGKALVLDDLVGVMNSRPANRAGRSSGVALRKSQMPWRSGWPSGVRGSVPPLVCAEGLGEAKATANPSAALAEGFDA
jgi:hypothetical protein